MVVDPDRYDLSITSCPGKAIDVGRRGNRPSTVNVEGYLVFNQTLPVYCRHHDGNDGEALRCATANELRLLLGNGVYESVAYLEKTWGTIQSFGQVRVWLE